MKNGGLSKDLCQKMIIEKNVQDNEIEIKK